MTNVGREEKHEKNCILSHRLLLWRQQSSGVYIVLDGW
jgi:hypothetical protein